MSETKFTPGPWSIEAGYGESGDFNEYWQIHDGLDAIVCSTSFCMAGSKEANAHLIAAAPDLYEALERLTLLCDQNGHPDEPEEVNAARAALAKARGETVGGGV